MYRLLAFDYDGTAAIDGALPDPRVGAAVAAAQAAGVRVVLATGRSFVSAAQYAAALALTDPVICFQGAMVKDLAGDRATARLSSPKSWLVEPLPPEPFREVLAFAEARRLDLTLYSEEALYHVYQHHPQAFYDRWFGLPMRQVGSFAEACRHMAAQGQHALKGLFIGEPAANEELIRDLQARFSGRLSIVRSHAFFVEALSPRATKGQALAFLADQFGIPQAETLAIGDSGNDISMIRWAGLGIAMGNATPDVQAAADWVAPSVEEHGLAVAIERFLLEGDAALRGPQGAAGHVDRR